MGVAVGGGEQPMPGVFLLQEQASIVLGAGVGLLRRVYH